MPLSAWQGRYDIRPGFKDASITSMEADYFGGLSEPFIQPAHMSAIEGSADLTQTRSEV